MAKELCENLAIEYEQIPAIVVAFNEPQMEKVKELVERGKQNGVAGIQLISREEILEREPNVNPEIIGGLVAPHAAIINPWEYAIALAETAVKNGVEVHLSTEVEEIEQKENFFSVKTSLGIFESRFIINAAGNYADRIHHMVGGAGFEQYYHAGEYFLFDKNQCSQVNSLVFSCSTEVGYKGTTILPTVHGNLLAGPDFFLVDEPDDVGIVGDRMEKLKENILQIVPSINFREVIREFSGIRPNTNISDFIVEESSQCKNFINLAGMKSPGLTAAPAIAKMGVDILQKCGLQLTEKPEFISTRERIIFRKLSEQDKKAVIANNPLYGQVICRCELVTEGEIVEAIHRPIVPTTLDAIKRRCNAGMGRCQSGFCGPLVQKILARELGVSDVDILLDEAGSYILTGATKGVQQ
ncbi:MAG: NAD(P)/FAD-dependent oxidoreductase [Sphaerochaetaceae bacterium]